MCICSCVRPCTGELTAEGIREHFNLYFCVFSICIQVYTCICVFCVQDLAQVSWQLSGSTPVALPLRCPSPPLLYLSLYFLSYLILFILIFFYCYLLHWTKTQNSQTDLYPCLSSVPAHPCCIFLCICFCI